MKRGHTITRQTGEMLAADFRKRRFGAYERQRAQPRTPADASGVRHFLTPSGGIPAFNNGTKQLGSATCREWKCSSGGVLSDAGSGSDFEVFNKYGAIAGSVYVAARENEAGLLVVVERPPQASFDVRLKPDGTALQKSTDGGVTWTNIATIGSC